MSGIMSFGTIKAILIFILVVVVAVGMSRSGSLYALKRTLSHEPELARCSDRMFTNQPALYSSCRDIESSKICANGDLRVFTPGRPNLGVVDGACTGENSFALPSFAKIQERLTLPKHFSFTPSKKKRSQPDHKDDAGDGGLIHSLEDLGISVNRSLTTAADALK